MSAYRGYCCKSRFAQGVGNSAGCRCGFRVKMRGTSPPHVKLTSDFANTSETIRIGDCFSFDSFAKNSSACNFRLLQQYLPGADIVAIQQQIYLNPSTVANGSADQGRKRFNV